MHPDGVVLDKITVKRPPLKSYLNL